MSDRYNAFEDLSSNHLTGVLREEAVRKGLIPVRNKHHGLDSKFPHYFAGNYSLPEEMNMLVGACRPLQAGSYVIVVESGKRTAVAQVYKADTPFGQKPDLKSLARHVARKK